MIKRILIKIRYPRLLLNIVYEKAPAFLWPIAEAFYRAAMRILYWGKRYTCCLCGAHIRKYLPLVTSTYRRPEAKICPVCRSGERLRFAWLVLRDKTNLLDGKPQKMLHIAPELCLTARLKKISGLDYLSADLNNPQAMVKMDITQIPHEDASFDIIFCSHVLEHIPDDQRALSELYRVLQPGGWAILIVPILRKETYEDPSVTKAADRQRIFGYPDHVRIVGHDYIDRIRQAGFAVTKYACGDLCNDGQMERMGLVQDWLFYCEKKAVQ